MEKEVANKIRNTQTELGQGGSSYQIQRTIQSPDGETLTIDQE